MMSLSTNSRDGRTAPSLLAVGIALALFPNLSQAAGAAEDTIIVEGSSDSASDTQEQDYSVRTTSAGTKMEMAQRDIRSRSASSPGSGCRINSYKPWAM